MTPMTLDELRELAPAYVMGTLSDSEFEAFRAALSDPALSDALQSELAIHRAVAQSLASMYEVAPPPSLKSRLEARLLAERLHDQQLKDERMAVERRAADRLEAERVMAERLAAERLAAERLAAERAAQERLEATHLAELRAAETREFAAPTTAPVTAPMAPRSPTPNDPLANAAPRSSRATHVTPPRVAVLERRHRAAPAWTAAGLLGLAMAASLFFAFNLRTRVKALESDLSAQTRIAELTAQRLAGRDSLVSTLTRAENDLVIVKLAAQDASKKSMQLYWNRKTGEAVMHASGLSPNAANKLYCLWVIRNGKPEAIALFSPDDDGHRLLNNVALPRNATGVSAFAVTEEPSAGSPLPTMTPFLVGAAQ